jgi:hypothetical protein
MIAVYAMGGGLGHLARARRVLAALGAAPGRAAIFTASRLAPAADPSIVRVPRRLAASPAAFAAWLKDALRALAPEAVVVDAFPLGILGELADHSVLPDAPLYHVARLLKWDAYRSAFAGTPRRYEATLAVEELTPRHAEFLDLHSTSMRNVELTFRVETESETPFPQNPFWLIVHSGPEAEVMRLLAFARAKAAEEGAAPDYVVVSPRPLRLPEGVRRISHVAPWTLYARAARIVTGCGFNSMAETLPWRANHLFLPLARRFDDQELRARRAAAAC